MWKNHYCSVVSTLMKDAKLKGNKVKGNFYIPPEFSFPVGQRLKFINDNFRDNVHIDNEEVKLGRPPKKMKTKFYISVGTQTQMQE